MINLLTGSNTYELEQHLSKLRQDFDGTAEIIDGSRLELNQLPDMLMGGTLFSDKRLVIIRNLSESKDVWSRLPDWLDRVSDDIDLVLIESKLDKRTSTYKELKKRVNFVELSEWSERDFGRAESWLESEAKSRGISIDKKSMKALLNRVGLNQWGLSSALDKLSLLDTIDEAAIEKHIEVSYTENIFNLFEASLSGDSGRVDDMLYVLEKSEDPYKLFGLVAGQAFQFAVLVFGPSPSEVASDIGAHPYALSKLSKYAKQFGKSGAKKIISIMNKADTDMKISRAEPWFLIRRALQEISNIQK